MLTKAHSGLTSEGEYICLAAWMCWKLQIWGEEKAN